MTYQQLIVGPDYRDDPRNARLLAGRAGRERGTIITADGVVVATSEADPDDPRVFRRIYPEDGLYAHVVGYATQLFGSSRPGERMGRSAPDRSRRHHLRCHQRHDG